MDVKPKSAAVSLVKGDGGVGPSKDDRGMETGDDDKAEEIAPKRTSANSTDIDVVSHDEVEKAVHAALVDTFKYANRREKKELQKNESKSSDTILVGAVMKQPRKCNRHSNPVSKCNARRMAFISELRSARKNIAIQDIEAKTQDDTMRHQQESKFRKEEEMIDVERVFQIQRREFSLDKHDCSEREKEASDDDDDENDTDYYYNYLSEDYSENKENVVSGLDYTDSLNQETQPENINYGELRRDSSEVELEAVGVEDIQDAAALCPVEPEPETMVLINQIQTDKDNPMTTIQNAVANEKPRYHPLPYPEQSLLNYINEKLSSINIDSRDCPHLGDDYVKQAFEKQFQMKKITESWNLKENELFRFGLWKDERSWILVNQWGKVRKLRKHAWDNWALDENAYKTYMSDMSLTPYLKSFIKKSFPSVVLDYGYDYLAIMEVVRIYRLEYEKVPDFSLVNIGDSDNIAERVYKDMGRNVFRYSVLDIQKKKDCERLFTCSKHYRWSFTMMTAFQGLLRRSYNEFKNYKVSYQNIDVIFQKIKNYGQDSDEQIEYNQCRQIYCTITLATLILKKGGSLIINASHVGYDGFFTGLMYLLALLFNEVFIIKPVATLDATVEIWIVAKSFNENNDRLQNLYKSIQDGNDKNIDQTFIRSRYPIPKSSIPKQFQDRVLECVKARCQWVIRPNLRNLSLLPYLEDQDVANGKTQQKTLTVFLWMDKVEMEDVIYDPLHR